MGDCEMSKKSNSLVHLKPAPVKMLEVISCGYKTPPHIDVSVQCLDVREYENRRNQF